MQDFDTVIDRSDTFSTKWNKYAGTDVLPFWVADMDFRSPDFVLEAIRQRLDHGILGYTDTPSDVVEAFLGWLDRLYGWRVDPEWLVWLPGVVPGMNLAGHAVGAPGDHLIVPVPVYHPFLAIAENSGKREQRVPLVRIGDQWCHDFERLEAAIEPATRAILICNPQNPTGRVYSRAELEILTDICVRHDLVLVSDEIHCQLVLDRPTGDDCPHTPAASLGQDIRDRSITLYSPNKAYNVAGLGCAVAVIPSRSLRDAFRAARRGMVGGISPLAYAAARAAFDDSSDWLPRLNRYLSANHDLLARTVAELPGVTMTPVEGTYLAWLDLNERRPGNPEIGAEVDPETLLRAHGIGVSNGAQFGAPGFVRFNFACPRSMLETGISRLREAFAGA